MILPQKTTNINMQHSQIKTNVIIYFLQIHKFCQQQGASARSPTRRTSTAKQMIPPYTVGVGALDDPQNKRFVIFP
jgi:hypothetical protein